MFDENRNFLFKSAKKHIFNGKEETTSKPQRMTHHLWQLKYNRVWGNVSPPNGLCLEIIYFNCVLLAKYVIDDHEGCQGITDYLPKGLKFYSREFSRLPYHENIGINVTKTWWKIFDGRFDKEKLAKIYRDIRDSNHAMKNIVQSNKNGDQIIENALPWLITE